ncbi:hypothetical protein [Caballeronia zhejiangensis]|uniref:hypothetical protein n=1 Tax=Caballeronia zhejiangensis TaxID=871203 RepID=UPI001EF4CDF7|nr:hypothetical protein [Caballeronia zhejiangensis]MCG7404825.1 hypothetical protein [Caballeronia zhejiangensis]
MSKENMLRGTMLTVTRRYAAGIDVSEDAVRLAIVSRRLRANAAVCVEHLESVARPSGAVVGGDFVDRAPIVAALREAFGRLPESGAWRALRCAMGLPSSATLTTQVPLARLIDTHEQLAAPIGGDPRGLLEPAVLAEAERAAGIERCALAVDWSVQTREDGDALVAIAATRRGASRDRGGGSTNTHGSCAQKANGGARVRPRSRWRCRASVSSRCSKRSPTRLFNAASRFNACRSERMRSSWRRSHPIRRQRRNGSSGWSACAACRRWK